MYMNNDQKKEFNELYKACKLGKVEDVKKLLKNENNVKFINSWSEGDTIGENKFTCLGIACFRGYVDVVKELVKIAHLSTIEGYLTDHKRVKRYLNNKLSRSGDAYGGKKTDIENRTSLYLAVKKNHPEIVKLIMSHPIYQKNHATLHPRKLELSGLEISSEIEEIFKEYDLEKKRKKEQREEEKKKIEEEKKKKKEEARKLVEEERKKNENKALSEAEKKKKEIAEQIERQKREIAERIAKQQEMARKMMEDAQRKNQEMLARIQQMQQSGGNVKKFPLGGSHICVCESCLNHMKNCSSCKHLTK